MKYENLIPAGIVFLLLVGACVYGFLQISTLTKNIELVRTELASSTAMLSQNADLISKDLTDLRAQTIGLSNTLSNAQQNIDSVKNQVGGVEQTVGTISGAVGTLEKLVKIDPELLKKYSKVYFMNENYTPAHLTNIPANYLYSETRVEQFVTEAWPFLQNLLATAKNAGKTLYIKSAYRSFAEQQTLKSFYTVVYGEGTSNAFSADQGYSEHQLGVTVDFITTGLSGKLDGFEKTEAYQWLLTNAHRFGFELSYPEGNNYYIFEPWHWRFVGVKLATDLYNKQMSFYNLDQREIDIYLVNIFD